MKDLGWINNWYSEQRIELPSGGIRIARVDNYPQEYTKHMNTCGWKGTKTISNHHSCVSLYQCPVCNIEWRADSSD